MTHQTIMRSKQAIGKGMLFLCLFVCFPLLSQAQSPRFACLSYEQVLHAMPEYQVACQSMDSLRAQFDAETRRMEQDFNNKYEEFLEVQHTLAPTILSKRQTELQELMQRGIAFKAEAGRLLQQAEADAMRPVYDRLDAMIAKLARNRGYAFVLNTDNRAVPYIDAAQGEDITDELRVILK